MKFTSEQTVIFKTPYCVLMCQKAVQGYGDGCPYAVCEKLSCEEEAINHQKSVLYKERKLTCHHKFHNLVDQYDLWWYKKKEINGLNWMELKDVYSVGGMFVV